MPLRPVYLRPPLWDPVIDHHQHRDLEPWIRHLGCDTLLWGGRSRKTATWEFKDAGNADAVSPLMK